MVRDKAYAELTDPDNEKVLGTLTHGAWVGLSVEDIASEWYQLGPEVDYLLEAANPAERVVTVARFSSGSIDGGHRKDLKDALVGSPASQSNLSVPIINQPIPGQNLPAPRPKERGF